MKTILDVVAELRNEDLPLQYLGADEDVSPGKFLEFELIDWHGTPRFAPAEALNLPGRPGGRPFMYRGERCSYPTCVASLFREAPRDERELKARLSLERFQVAELELLMGEHPFGDVAKRYGFSVDYHALAQHYGIRTSLLDLTSKVEVAAFFAVAEWDKEQHRFVPMEDGPGVLYRFDWCAFGPGYSRAFDPVGFGPGLRAARQHAWTFHLRPGVDFHKVPHVEPFEFTHSRSASKEIFDRFDDGKSLYPPDCLASLIEKLAKLPFVTMHAIRHAARTDGVAPEKIEETADRAAYFIHTVLGTDIVDGRKLLPEEADLDVARQQAAGLDERIRAMRKGFRIVEVPRGADNTETR